MSDFFGNLGNYRMPDVQMNKGPLPTIAGGPAGSNGIADGRYNFNSDLLNGITPYAYGESARMGSDKNYQQIPHRLQKIIPMLYLPAAQQTMLRGMEKVTVSHSVDMGDVAFALSTIPDYIHTLLSPRTDATISTQNRNALYSFTPFCNFVTVNYILAGLQRFGNPGPAGQESEHPWHELYKCFGYQANSRYKIFAQNPSNNKELDAKHALPEVLRILRTHMLPFGICAGSEHQGGKHEKSLLPVQAAVNHVTTMTIDGQNRDLVNYWRQSNINAGDTLTFQPRLMTSHYYTLNHYYKAQSVVGFEKPFTCWQLEPVVLVKCPRWLQDKFSHDALRKAYPGPTQPNDQRAWKSYDEGKYMSPLGYWRIGQMMHFRGSHMVPNLDINNAMQYLTGGLLQVTFAPVWEQEMGYSEMVEFVEQGGPVTASTRLPGNENPYNFNQNHIQRREQHRKGVTYARFDGADSMDVDAPAPQAVATNTNHRESGWLARGNTAPATETAPAPETDTLATALQPDNSNNTEKEFAMPAAPRSADAPNPLEELLAESQAPQKKTGMSLDEIKQAAAEKLSGVVGQTKKKAPVKRKVSTVDE